MDGIGAARRQRRDPAIGIEGVARRGAVNTPQAHFPTAEERTHRSANRFHAPTSPQRQRVVDPHREVSVLPAAAPAPPPSPPRRTAAPFLFDSSETASLLRDDSAKAPAAAAATTSGFVALSTGGRARFQRENLQSDAARALLHRPTYADEPPPPGQAHRALIARRVQLRDASAGGGDAAAAASAPGASSRSSGSGGGAFVTTSSMTYDGAASSSGGSSATARRGGVAKVVSPAKSDHIVGSLSAFLHDGSGVGRRAAAMPAPRAE